MKWEQNGFAGGRDHDLLDSSGLLIAFVREPYTRADLLDSRNQHPTKFLSFVRDEKVEHDTLEAAKLYVEMMV